MMVGIVSDSKFFISDKFSICVDSNDECPGNTAKINGSTTHNGTVEIKLFTSV